VVTVSLDPKYDRKLAFSCSVCTSTCEHIGAALSLILEEKMALGLAAPPPEMVPIESLSDEELIERALEDRGERAKKEKMKLESADPGELWTDYTITSSLSGKTYRLALRGWERGESYCSCADFKINTLGTCKHIIFALNRLKKKFTKAVRNRPYQRKHISLHLRYGREAELRLLFPPDLNPEAIEIVKPLKDKVITDVRDLLTRVRRLEGAGQDVIIYPDAEEYINNTLFRLKTREKIEEIRSNPKNHPLRKSLLKQELLPYQLDGIAFAVGAGRAVLADDMGLGKTIMGIGIAELFARETGIGKTLIICPASVKSQWRLEIGRFSGRSCQIVLGSAKERALQYDNGAFFTICNYEQVLRDINSIERTSWDLIILDEGQRIKNWEAKTTRIVKVLRSPYALVLSGTPLENRLDDLYSVVQFIDDQRLGPAYYFFNRHKVVNERGRLLGYRNLNELREKLKPILLRRTRSMVLRDLPPRSTEIRRIPPTDEQIEIHDGQRRIISSIVSKKYITEMDLLRLQKALLICRMAADSTYLVDKIPPGYSSKLEEIDSLLDQLTAEEDRKILLFSEWTTMLNLIEPLIEKRKIGYIRLDGSVPQKKRQGLLHQFNRDPDCKLFITTNAGATGLNLQAANTVINVDLPWNPAVLEQRISRAHRMGQKRPIQVFLLVTEETIEENLLNTLSAKHELALAVLDPESTINEMSFAGGMEELKRRLEVLLGEKPPAPVDESRKKEAEIEAAVRVRKEKVAKAGGQLLSAAFAFVGELMGTEAESSGSETEQFKKLLSECIEKKEDGSLEMKVRFPDNSALDNLADILSRITESVKR
jgi:SNF2 family DNA or RNA helicase